MTALTVGRALALLPEGDSYQGLREALARASRPRFLPSDTGYGEWGLLGERIVEPRGLEEQASGATVREGRRLHELVARVARGIAALAAGRREEGVERFLEASELEGAAGRARAAEALSLSAFMVAREGEGAGSSGTILPGGVRALRLAARWARGRGDLLTASHRYEEAFRLAEALGLAEDRRVAAMGRGNVEVDRGRWDAARSWYVQVEEALRSQGLMGSREGWELRQNLAILAMERGALDESEALLREGEDLARRLNDDTAWVGLHHEWGLLLQRQGEPGAAEARLRSAWTRAAHPLERVVVAASLGTLLLERGRSLEAAELARRAEAEALLRGVEYRLPEVQRLLSRVAEQRGDADEALSLLLQALDTVRRFELPEVEEARTLAALAELRERQGEGGVAGALREEALRIFRKLGQETSVARLEAAQEESEDEAI